MIEELEKPNLILGQETVSEEHTVIIFYRLHTMVEPSIANQSFAYPK
jgi:hypothetical protein